MSEMQPTLTQNEREPHRDQTEPVLSNPQGHKGQIQRREQGDKEMSKDQQCKIHGEPNRGNPGFWYT